MRPGPPVLIALLATPLLWGANLRHAVGWEETATGVMLMRQALKRPTANVAAAQPDTAATTAPVEAPWSPSVPLLRQASEHLERARTLAPENPWPLLFLGLAATHGGDAEAARRLLEEFAGLHPADAGVAVRAWLDYRGEGGPDPFCGLDVSRGPLSPAAALWAAWVALHRRDLPTTRQLLSRAEDARDVSAEYHELLALLAVEDGKGEDALRELKQARTLSFSKNRLNNYGATLDGFEPSLALEGTAARLRRGPWSGRLLPPGRLGRERSAGLLYNLAVLNHAQQDWNRGLFLAEIIRKTVPAELVTAERMPDLDLLEYPFGWRAAVQNGAEAAGLDPSLVFAVIRQESKFAPTARSRASAHGLMQITDDTGRWLALVQKTPWREGMLDDPVTNIRMGSWYLAHLRDKFKDTDTQFEWALAAYNAGLGNAERWLRRWKARGKPKPMTDFLAYAETKDYVIGVMASWQAYKKLQARQRPLPPE